MQVTDAAVGFAAIGSPARLDVLRILVRAGKDGLPVGEIQSRTGIPGSTLNHHLGALRDAGLIIQSREGRAVRTCAAFDNLEALAAFILRECCADSKGLS